MSLVPHHILPDSAVVTGDGELEIGGCLVSEMAARYGTPLFIYDIAHIRSRCAAVVGAFGEGATYAAKAFLCRAMAQLVHSQGMRLDVASGGEIHVALAAGVPADRMVFHGNNKSETEIAFAIGRGIGRIVVDSFDEMTRLEALSGSGAPVPDVSLRITPGVEAHTHEYVSTGQNDSKFGFTVSTGAAREAVERALASSAMRLVGTHAHIGSQVFRVDSFRAALSTMWDFSRPYPLEELAIGGGLGVAYLSTERAPTIEEWCSALSGTASDLGIDRRISVEPGRAIVAGSAITVYTVGTVKEIPGIRTYVAVDGGMSDNPRPVLYGSGYETFSPTKMLTSRSEPIRLVGKHCESGDVLVREGRVAPGLAPGDLVATPVTGAYGHSMGSNYNKILRPAVIFVEDGRSRVVVRRETYEDLLACDVDGEWIWGGADHF